MRREPWRALTPGATILPTRTAPLSSGRVPGHTPTRKPYTAGRDHLVSGSHVVGRVPAALVPPDDPPAPTVCARPHQEVGRGGAGDWRPRLGSRQGRAR